MNIDEFLNALGKTAQFPIAERATREDWVTISLETDPEFVPPPLQGGIPDGARVVLMSGPGAAGKSMLARWCAAKANVAYFNLTGRTVARDSARGLIGEAFSDSRYSEIVRAIREGRYTLMFDALDEARLASGEGPFEDFLRGLADLVREHQGCVSVVLFSRNETATWAELVFDDSKLAGVARLELQPFSERNQAIEVIFQHCRRWYKSRKDEEPPSWSRELSEELLDVAQEVAKGFGSEKTQQAFWGYGALLASLGRLLSEAIISGARRGDLRARFTKNSKLGPDLFLRVAQELLEREQCKFIAAAREKLKQRAEGFSGWDQLYSKEEQCRRLLSRKTGVPLHEPLPRELPDILRDGYETLVNQALPEHPFVGLSPYEEYLRAYFLVYETDDNRRREFQQLLDKTLYLPTPILAWCLLAMSPKADCLRADNLGYLVESWLAHPELGAALRIVIEGTGGNIVVHADGAAWIPEIRLTEVQRGLWFWRRLNRATINIDCDVNLGTGDHDFVLGPDVDLECGQLSCDSKNLRIHVGKDDKDDADVVVRANAIEGQPRLSVYGLPKRFLVFSPDLLYPWVQFKAKVPPVRPSNKQIQDAFADLRQILSWFRARGYGELGRNADFIDTRVIGQNETRREIMNYCIEQGLIFRDGGLYKLNSENIDKLGINLTQLRYGVLTEKLEVFFNKFLSARKSSL